MDKTAKKAFSYQDLLDIDYVCEHLDKIHAVDSLSWEQHLMRFGAYVYSKYHNLSSDQMKEMLAS